MRDTWIESIVRGGRKKAHTVQEEEEKFWTEGGRFHFRPRDHRARNVHFETETRNWVTEFLASVGAKTGRAGRQQRRLNPIQLLLESYLEKRDGKFQKDAHK